MNEESKVFELKSWIENEAEFRVRTDDDFLLMFLRSCDFDFSLTKKKLVLYYQNRTKYPEWWANRSDSKHLQLISLKSVAILIDKTPDLPTVMIAKFRCLGSDSSIFNAFLKLSGLEFEMAARRPNCQKNGFILICDCKDYASWLAFKLLWPTTLRNAISSFLHAMPINMLKMILVHSPTVATVIHRIGYPFLGTLQQKIHFVGSDLSKLAEHVPLEMLPVEYGGHAEPFDQHHDACFNEIQECNQYLIEDEKFGYKSAVEPK